MTKDFHIPLPYLGFREKTLILCVGRGHDNFWKIRVLFGAGNIIQDYTEFAPDEIKFDYSDREGLSFSQRRHGSGGTRPGEKHNKEHYLGLFTEILALKIKYYCKLKKFEKVVLFVPKDLKYAVIPKLPRELRDRTEIFVKNMMKTPLKDMSDFIFTRRQKIEHFQYSN